MPLPRITYTVIPTYFMQTEARTDDSTFDFITTSFGIIKPAGHEEDKSSRAGWSRLRQRLQQLNRESREDGQRVTYKLLFVVQSLLAGGRHGEGVHNIAKKRYGAEAWEAKWSKLGGDEHCVWGFDSLLTARGEDQAREVSELWAKLRKESVLFPEKFYSSPKTRCVHTARLTFEALDIPGWDLVVIGGLRGRFKCEKGGGMGSVEESETDEEMDVRVRGFLDDIFENDRSEVISFTTHGGFIASIFRVVGHRHFDMPTAAVIPLLVKAEKKSS